MEKKDDEKQNSDGTPSSVASSPQRLSRLSIELTTDAWHRRVVDPANPSINADEDPPEEEEEGGEGKRGGV
jgi:hypothetical protein